MIRSEEYFIAVHGGAGFHHPDNDKATKRALRQACKNALMNLSSEQSLRSLTSVEQAIISLEDDSHFNAGYGSNLTLDGTVECDAAIYTAGPVGSQGHFGSVGAVSGVKNPISAARCILEYSKNVDKLSRVPPLTLVSGGAVNFIKKHGNGINLVAEEDMISPNARKTWVKWKDRLEKAGSLPDDDIMDDEEVTENIMQDTVGAVAWHPRDGFSAGVSSGGILLKCPGRLGEAGVFGAGCWAQHQSNSSAGMACSISGTGEEIVRVNLARSIGDGYNPATDIHELLHRMLVEQIWKPARRRGLQDPAAGVLLITRETDEDTQGTARVWCGFTTASMAIGFASSKDSQPKAYILRRPERKGPEGEEAHVYITAFKI